MAEVVELHRTYRIDELTVDEYPMVYAFWKLNLTLSNTAQSAPGCVSQKTKAEWNAIEDVMFEKMEANVFVMLALGLDQIEAIKAGENPDDYIFEQYFPDWAKDWV
jgi:hypothetical protein